MKQFKTESQELYERVIKLENFILLLQKKCLKKAEETQMQLIKDVYTEIAYDLGNVDGVPNNIDSF